MTAYTIDPGGAGDYSSLGAFLADVGTGVTADLSSGGHVVTCESSDASEDTATVADTIDGFTNASATNFVDFVGDGTYVYSAEDTFSNNISIETGYTRVRGFIINTSTGNAITPISAANLAASTSCQISHNLITHSSGNNPIGINLDTSNSGCTLNVWNNVVHYDGSGSPLAGINCNFPATSTTYEVHNNTIIGGYTIGLKHQGTNGGGNIRNNYIGDATTCLTATGSATTSNNATSDTTGDTGLQSIAVNTTNFTAPASDDFSLPSGSALIDEGTTIAAFSDDIDGTSRGATWDIGAYEFVSAPTGGRIMSSLTNHGGLAGHGGIAGKGGGLAG